VTDPDSGDRDALVPASAAATPGRRLAPVRVRAAIAVGAVLGLALGIVVSVTTDLPFAPEGGLVLGALLGWLSRRKGTR
jgi:hypothetical protein